jgi:hypothetical protein
MHGMIKLFLLSEEGCESDQVSFAIDEDFIDRYFEGW